VSSAPLSCEHAAILAAALARLIPTDEHGPGAREAGVERYIERALGAEQRRHRDAYVRGLSALQASARARHGGDFDALSVAAQDAVLAQAERETDTAGFFALLRGHALEGMFGDPCWGGNAGQVGWALLGYPGPRPAWSERDQQLDLAPDHAR
jgi:gluconate 2-dehydrogenase gamma chain